MRRLPILALLAGLTACAPAPALVPDTPQTPLAPAKPAAAAGVTALEPARVAPALGHLEAAIVPEAPTGPPVRWHLASVPGTATASSGPAPNAVDGDGTTEWNPRADVSRDHPQWLALPLAHPATGTLCVVWHGHGLHFTNTGYGTPRTYEVQTSSDSTNGDDGHWQVASRVTDNPMRSRATLLAAPGARWVRLSFLESWDTFFFEPFLREAAVYETSDAGAPDVWCFMGDSITSVAFDPAKPDVFPTTVAGRHAGFLPIVIPGATGGDESADALARLAIALPGLPTGSVVAMCYGANDAAHGVGPEAYRTRMQAAIDAVRAAHDRPVLAVLPWNLNGDLHAYAEVCRSLAASNHLPDGPDFYSYFKAHPDQLEFDHVHPNADGIRAMQTMWGSAADFRYGP